MHGTGVYDYASSGDVESQVYLCPFAPCTEKMMAKGECLTFIQAVAVKTPKHNLVFRSDSLYVDGARVICRVATVWTLDTDALSTTYRRR